jgi:GT2 family glycosyltransferase
VKPFCPPSKPTRIVANVINFNTATLTLQCVEALLQCDVDHVVVLDNASAAIDRSALAEGLERLMGPGSRVELTFSEINLGFAGGSNRLIEHSLHDASVTHVFLINSDSIVDPSGFATWRAEINGDADLWGARVHQANPVGQTDEVESLGIAIYRPLLASNRKHLDDRFLGPTGGCAIYSRRLLEELQLSHGYIFDPDYFCYAEDTDVCLRARLLGYEACYCDALVARHLGQASSGGGFNDFVYYHGIRNSIWTMLKCIPLPIFLRNLGWVLLLHAGILVRHTVRGKLRVTIRLYRDTLLGMMAVWRKRRVVQDSRRVETGTLVQWITPRFYEQDYLRTAIRDLFVRKRVI